TTGTHYNFRAVSYANAATVVVDARGNRWGTEDAALIAAKILDWTDSSSSPVVDYDGYLDASGQPAFAGVGLNGSVQDSRVLGAGAYEVQGKVQVNGGVTLTIEAGATVELPAAFPFLVNGTLLVEGTPSAEVHFRSGRAQPAANDWTGIQVLATGQVNIEHARIEHATRGIDFNGGTGLVRRSVLTNNQRGIYLSAGASPQIVDGNEIVGNTVHGIEATNGGSNPANNPMPVVNGNTIAGNGTTGTHYNFRAVSYANAATVVVDARENWWGALDAAAIASKIFDRNNSTGSPRVEFCDFLASADGQPALAVYEVKVESVIANPYAQSEAAVRFVSNSADLLRKEVFSEGSQNVLYSEEDGPHACGPLLFTWDGAKNDGGYAPDGHYYVAVTSIRNGDQAEYVPPPASGVGSGTGSIPASFKPYRNQFWKMAYNLSGSAPKLVRMRVTPPSGMPFYPIDNEPYPPGTSWIYWDGRDPDGEIVTGNLAIYFFAPLNLRESTVIVQGTTPRITGPGTAPDIEVKPDPYFVVHSYEQQSRFAFKVDQDAYVSVKLLPPGIHDPEDLAAIPVLEEELLAADQVREVVWLGYDLEKENRVLAVDEGAFTLAIVARGAVSGVSSLYRGVLHAER
ncbi:MAG TPA: FlgD immunoglobulin-like domain containing protein, partial [Xanthomonadaceae bacterium]|nr:FlgD immunoglobulin-like domain containing protein [Xanthomonadaceae bacterium]